MPPNRYNVGLGSTTVPGRITRYRNGENVALSSITSGARRAEPFDRGHLERRYLIARRLVPAVERLLESETFPELTVDQMVVEARISRSTFYNYFEGKEDLLRAMTGEVMSAVVDATRVWWMLPPGAPKEELLAALRHLYEFYAPHSSLMLAVAESVPYDSRVRDEFMAYMEQVMSGIRNYIRSGQEAGILRPEIDAELAAQWLTCMFERGLSKLSRASRNLDPARMVDSAADIIWKALH